MSQIDEAFIQAYATPQPFTDAVVLGAPTVSPAQPQAQPQSDQSQSSLAGLHRGPHIELSPAPQASNQQPTSQQTNARIETPQAVWAPEPVPAPHFVVPNEQPAIDLPVRSLAAEAAAPLAGIATQNTAAQATAAQSPTTQRRPLSTFSAPEQPATTAFNPVFEVDAFRWPKITDDLLDAHGQLLIPVAEQLVTVSEQGRSLIGMVGTRTDVGCSTLLMSLARLVSSIGKSVALVDANFAKASLASDLGLEFNTGWENVLTGELPLAECVVKSLEDRIALLPLAKPHAAPTELLGSIHTSVTAGVLRYHYDVVLFNLGAAAQMPQDASALSIMQHCRLDAGIIVADTETTGIEPMDTLISIFGHNCLGVIGNSAA